MSLLHNAWSKGNLIIWRYEKPAPLAIYEMAELWIVMSIIVVGYKTSFCHYFTELMKDIDQFTSGI